MRTTRGRLRPLFFFTGVVAGLACIQAALRRLGVVEVTGRSMAPALLPGDRLVVQAVSLRRRPPRVGEVVLAPDPRLPERELVKRVARVAEGLVDLRGDAPDESTDSRAFGSLPVERVRWLVAFRYWPPDRIGTVATAPER
jgi:nickel-type superoxide dismutase maturation protease